MNKHKKIKSRPDKKRPFTVGEMIKRLSSVKYYDRKDFVMSIKILHVDGSSSSVSWSEKLADKYTAEEAST